MDCKFSKIRVSNVLEVNARDHITPQVQQLRYRVTVLQSDGKIDENVRHRFKMCGGITLRNSEKLIK